MFIAYNLIFTKNRTNVKQIRTDFFGSFLQYISLKLFKPQNEVFFVCKSHSISNKFRGETGITLKI